MKIAVIGAGSSYTPELVEGLLHRSGLLSQAELVLSDIDAVRLDLVIGFIRRMTTGSSLRLRSTLDPADAVSGADFIITQIRVGGNQARREDELLARRHGLIGQETTGVGGFAKALRTIPVILDLCRLIEASAPSAWLINFTNPSGLITAAVLRYTKVKCIGLCNIPLTFLLDLARALGLPPEEVELDYVGLNHLSWVRGVKAAGRDVTAEVLAWAASPSPGRALRELDYPPSFLAALGMIPLHYLRYYYLTDRMLAEQKEKPRTRAEEVMEIEAELFRLYADVNQREKPALLSRRGGANYSLAALNLMESLLTNRQDIQIVNVQNQGTLAELPAAAVMETPCRIGAEGAIPLSLRPLEPSIVGLIRTISAYEELTLAAAVKGDYQKALLALTIHPLGPGTDRAEEVLDDILAVHRLKLERR